MRHLANLLALQVLYGESPRQLPGPWLLEEHLYAGSLISLPHSGTHWSTSHPLKHLLHCADLCSRDFCLTEYLHRDVWLDLYQSAFNSLTPSSGRWVPDVRDSLTSSLIQSCLTIFLSQVLITEQKENQSGRETRTTFLCRDGLEPDLNGEEERRNGCAAAAWFYTVNTSLQCLQIPL